jgi:hypothetical protein
VPVSKSQCFAAKLECQTFRKLDVVVRDEIAGGNLVPQTCIVQESDRNMVGLVNQSDRFATHIETADASRDGGALAESTFRDRGDAN